MADCQNEEWRGIPGFDGLYEASNLGRIRSNKNPKDLGFIMTAAISEEQNGYKNIHIKLYKDGKRKQYRLPRLIWETFRGRIPDGFHVDHIDNDQTNNRLDNLQVLSLADNNRKRWKDNPDLKSNGGVERIKVRCVETGKIFSSLNEAARFFNGYNSNIRRAIKESHRKACGFHWVLA